MQKKTALLQMHADTTNISALLQLKGWSFEVGLYEVLIHRQGIDIRHAPGLESGGHMSKAIYCGGRGWGGNTHISKQPDCPFNQKGSFLFYRCNSRCCRPCSLFLFSLLFSIKNKYNYLIMGSPLIKGSLLSLCWRCQSVGW